jgi:hypothetical protein
MGKKERESVTRSTRKADRKKERRKWKRGYLYLERKLADGTIHLELNGENLRLFQELTEAYFAVDPIGVKGFGQLGFPDSSLAEEYRLEAAVVVSKLWEESESYESVVWKVWDTFHHWLDMGLPCDAPRLTRMSRLTYDAWRIARGMSPVSFPEDAGGETPRMFIPMFVD